MDVEAISGYLFFLDALDSDFVASALLDGHIGVSKLAMAEKLSKRILRLEVFLVTKVGPLS